MGTWRVSAGCPASRGTRGVPRGQRSVGHGTFRGDGDVGTWGRSVGCPALRGDVGTRGGSMGTRGCPKGTGNGGTWDVGRVVVVGTGGVPRGRGRGSAPLGRPLATGTWGCGACQWGVPCWGGRGDTGGVSVVVRTWGNVVGVSVVWGTWGWGRGGRGQCQGGVPCWGGHGVSQGDRDGRDVGRGTCPGPGDVWGTSLGGPAVTGTWGHGGVPR